MSKLSESSFNAQRMSLLLLNICLMVSVFIFSPSGYGLLGIYSINLYALFFFIPVIGRIWFLDYWEGNFLEKERDFLYYWIITVVAVFVIFCLVFPMTSFLSDDLKKRKQAMINYEDNLRKSKQESKE